jgi:DNA ligase 1
VDDPSLAFVTAAGKNSAIPPQSETAPLHVHPSKGEILGSDIPQLRRSASSPKWIRMLRVIHQRGLHLPDHDLWLDPYDPRPFAFVSHAHSDHTAAHQEVLLSAGTAALMRARVPGQRREHVLAFGETEELRGGRVTLLSAGHIFGSAQFHFETSAGSLLYTGDFKLRPGLSAEPCEWRHAQTLVMETTYGLPRYRLPPTKEVMAQMVAFCEEALAEGAVPVLLGYSLGKSQEILCAILNAGLTPMLHGSVWNMTEIYRELKPDFPTGYVRYAQGQVEGKVLVCPPSAARSTMVRRIRKRRLAILTGWALDPGAVYRYQCDAAFPLSDHADYDDLLRYVDLVKPERVLTLHGFAAAFASDLRERGIEAWALTEANQMELSLPAPKKAAVRSAAPCAETGGETGTFAEFASVAEQVGATSSRLRKVELLSAFLSALERETELPLAITFFSGRALAPGDERKVNAGGAVIWRALRAATGAPEERLREFYSLHRDAGKAAYDTLGERAIPPAICETQLAEVAQLFSALAEARGPLVKTELLAEFLRPRTALQGSYVIRILTGDLRVGLKGGLVEEAIAQAFAADLGDVREAAMLTGDLGETGRLAALGRLRDARLRLFQPLQPMLASPLPLDPVERALELERLGVFATEYWAEPKFDGIRAQLHVERGRVEIYTRDLKRVTGQFADVARAAKLIEPSVILDGELIAFAENAGLSFFDLQKRLGRKTEDDLFAAASDVPVTFRAFDLLAAGGESLLRLPLRDRRAALEKLTLPAGVEVASVSPVRSASEAEAAFRAERQRGHEGLVLKDSASLYQPGRRGQGWLKVKEEFATLDVVVVFVEPGHGKRSHVLSDYTFAVRDEHGQLWPIGKAYSGLTDEEIEEFTEHFRANTIAKHGRVLEVQPNVILEVAFDTIQPSDRHPSGLALRFPRIKRIRRDKTVNDIDTLDYAWKLANRARTAGAPG